MSSADKASLLANLRDIHEPPAPEPGWPWLITAIVIGLMLLLVLWKNRPHKAASIATQQINAARVEPTAQALVRLARLLRSRAINHSTTSDAQAQGEVWLQTLDTHFSTTFFTSDMGRVFGNELYQKQSSDLDIATLCDQLQLLFNADQTRVST